MSTTKKTTTQPEGFDALIAKRAESVGGDGRSFTVPGFGRDWQIAAPDLQNAEWNDRQTDLAADFQDNVISMADYRDELLDLFLGDQADDFAKACDGVGEDPARLINEIVAEYADQRRENPTQGNSRAIRRRSKRR